jgi:hemerythrin
MKYDDFKRMVESCHLNFLLGSGASKPFLKTLNDVENLLTHVITDDEVDTDTKKIVEASIKYYYLEKCIKGNLNINEEGNNHLDKTKGNYNGFIRAIQGILAKRRSNLVSKQANLFTTNMDAFLEWTLEENQLAYNDGFFGRLKPVYGTENFHNTIMKTSTHYEYQSEIPLFNLFKLHGSVSWKLIEDKITFDEGFSILKKVADIEFFDDGVVEIEYQDGEDWKTKTYYEIVQDVIENDCVLDEEHDEFLESYNELVMINPTKQKFEITTRDLTFYELLRIYSNHLERENSVLFVMGFSFEDEHIREITKRVARSNPTLTIVIFAFDRRSKERIAELLGDHPNIKFIWDDTEEEPINYSLDVINRKYFEKLAIELGSIKGPQRVAVEIINNNRGQDGGDE